MLAPYHKRKPFPPFSLHPHDLTRNTNHRHHCQSPTCFTACRTCLYIYPVGQCPQLLLLSPSAPAMVMPFKEPLRKRKKAAAAAAEAAVASDGRKRRNCVGKKVEALRKLVPCGESMDIGKLLTEAASYISALQMRAKALRDMVRVLSGD